EVLSSQARADLAIDFPSRHGQQPALPSCDMRQARSALLRGGGIHHASTFHSSVVPLGWIAIILIASTTRLQILLDDVMVPVTIPSARRGRHPRATDDAIRIGLAIPLQGPGGIFGPSCEAVAQLYRQQVNSTTGVLGRPIEYEVIDAGQPPRIVAHQV